MTARHSNRFRVSVNTSPHRLEEKTRKNNKKKAFGQIQSIGGKDNGIVGAVGDDVVDHFWIFCSALSPSIFSMRSFWADEEVDNL